MKVFGDMSLGGLSQLVNGEAPEGGAVGLAARVLDSDGDGRSDLFLVDADNDGTVDGVVRGLDMNGDGQNDAYIAYNEDGSVRSIGRVSATGDLEVVYEEPGLFDQLLADLGLVDLPSPEEALFTSFDDPYIVGTYGEYGDDLPDEIPEPLVVEPSDVVEMDESEYLELSGAATVVDDGSSAADDAYGLESSGGWDASAGATDGVSADETSSVTAAEASAETSTESPGDVSSEAGTSEGQPGEPVAPEILEVGDHGDGWLYAEVDVDGDGVADRTDDLQRTVDGWEGDVNRDGSKETVAFDADRDGRVDSVDKSGSGDWAGSTQAWEVVREPSLVDDGLYQGDEEAAVVAADSSGAGEVDVSTIDDTSTIDDGGGAVDTTVDTDVDTSYDSGASVDTSSSYDSGSSDVGSTVDSGGGGVDET